MAVRFSAGTQIYTSTAGGITGNTATVTCWVYCSTDRNDYSGIWRLATSGDALAASLYFDADGTTITCFDANFSAVTGVSVTVGTWYRTALVMSGTTWTLYWGAAGAATLSSSSSPSFQAISSPPRFGIGGTAAEFLNGRVANVKLWEAALGTAEIEAALQQYAPHRSTNLRRFHPFLQAEQTDYSANNSTLSGGTGTTTEAGPPIPWTHRPPPPALYAPARARAALR